MNYLDIFNNDILETICQYLELGDKINIFLAKCDNRFYNNVFNEVLKEAKTIQRNEDHTKICNICNRGIYNKCYKCIGCTKIICIGCMVAFSNCHNKSCNMCICKRCFSTKTQNMYLFGCMHNIFDRCPFKICIKCFNNNKSCNRHY